MKKEEPAFYLRYEILHLRDFRDKFLPELELQTKPKIEKVIDLLLTLLEQNLRKENTKNRP